jgi:hypothetical protein
LLQDNIRVTPARDFSPSPNGRAPFSGLCSAPISGTPTALSDCLNWLHPIIPTVATSAPAAAYTQPMPPDARNARHACLGKPSGLFPIVVPEGLRPACGAGCVTQNGSIK